MHTEQNAGTVSKRAVWAGWILSGLAIAFMLFDGGIKLVPLGAVIETSGSLGLPTCVAFTRGLGVLALGCTALYAFPRAAVLGAILLTAYLGGAVATHARVGSPVFSHLLFGAYLAAMVWADSFFATRASAR